jgi:hypothetical protein
MAFEPTNNGLSDEKLTWAVWWVEHRLQIKRAATVLLGILAFAFLAYGLYGFGDWMFGSGVRERQQIATLPLDLVNAEALRQTHAPQNIGVEDTIVLTGGTGKYDLAARVTNPNARWWVEFDYRFEIEAEGVSHHGYILPNQPAFALALGVRSEARPSSPALAVSNLTWHRVDAHATLPNYEAWSAARLALTVSGITFTSPQAGDALGISRATFTVKNDTAFGYHTVGFVVSLLSGGRLVGINEVTISELRAGESREVTATWFSDLPSVSRVEVQPEVNIFSARSYLAPGE